MTNATYENGVTFAVPPVMSAANITNQTLAVTANVIPNANITFTGTIVSPTFGFITYENMVDNTGTVNNPLMTFTLHGIAEPELTTINFGNVQAINFSNAQLITFQTLTSLSAPDATYVDLNSMWAPLLTTLSLPSATYFDWISTGPPLSSLATLSLPNVTQMDVFNIPLPALTTLSLPSLTEINAQ